MQEERIILGLIEEVTLIGASGRRAHLLARIDTGATSSSMDLGTAAKLDLGPITKSRIIKSALGTKKRPVIRVKIEIGGIELEEDFNLAERSHMKYLLLIGQNILKKGQFMIDPHKK